MYETFYGLRERPFDLTPNAKFLYLTASHREALSNLQYGISGRKGMTLLIGEAGTGKTTIVRAALEAVAGPYIRCVYLSNPVLSREEFYEFMAPKFGLSDRAAISKARFLVELEETVVGRHRAGGLTALVIDEAQSLPHDLLEEVRLLANFETATEKLLPVVLAGQPELAVRLEKEELRQLKQRVALRCDLAALDIRETAAYIAGRVAIAGGDSSRTFTREAVQTIYERSRGIPRTISVICDNALLTGFAARVKPIGSNIVLEVCRDFRLPQFKVTELKPLDPPISASLLAMVNGTAGPPAARTDDRGNGARPAGAQLSPGSEYGQDEADGAGPIPRNAAMFSHFTRRRRFSFFG
jgi:general secretion pathway protein A